MNGSLRRPPGGHNSPGFSEPELERLSAQMNSPLPAVQAAVANAVRNVTTETLSRLYERAGYRAYYDEDLETAEKWFEAHRRLAILLNDYEHVSMALFLLGRIAQKRDDLSEARRFFDESLSATDALYLHSSERLSTRAYALHNLGLLDEGEGHLVPAQAHFEELVAVCRELKENGFLATALYGLSRSLSKQERYTEAEEALHEAIELQRGLGDLKEVVIALRARAFLARQRQNTADALAYSLEGVAVARETGDRSLLAAELYNAAYKLSYQEAWDDARRLAEECLQVAPQTDREDRVLDALYMLGWIEYKTENIPAARMYMWRVADLAMSQQNVEMALRAFYHLALLAEIELDYTTAKAAWQEAVRLLHPLDRTEDCGWVLLQLAVALGETKENEIAARLLCSLDHLNRTSDKPATEKRDATIRWWLWKLRKTLGWRAFRAIRRWSRSQTLSSLVRYALQEATPSEGPQASG